MLAGSLKTRSSKHSMIKPTASISSVAPRIPPRSSATYRHWPSSDLAPIGASWNATKTFFPSSGTTAVFPCVCSKVSFASFFRRRIRADRFQTRPLIEPRCDSFFLRHLQECRPVAYVLKISGPPLTIPGNDVGEVLTIRLLWNIFGALLDLFGS